MVTVGQQAVLDVLAILAGALYLWVAYTLYQRPIQDANRGAMQGFITWWGGLGTLILAGVVWRRLGAAALSDVLAVSYTGILIAVLITAIGGLVYYLLFIYTGRRSLLFAVIAFYVAFALALVALIAMQDPFIGPDPETGDVGIQYRDPLPPAHPMSITISAALLLPPFLAAGAYLFLYTRVKDRQSRFRILMVAGGIALWFGYSTLSSAARIAAGTTEQGFAGALTGQLLGILSAALVLIAYRPPARLEKWLRDEPDVDPEVAGKGIRREAAWALRPY